MSTRHGILMVFVMLLTPLVTTVSCGGDEGCTKDTDCKGTRLCIEGVCVFPPSQSGTQGASTAGTSAPSEPIVKPTLPVPEPTFPKLKSLSPLAIPKYGAESGRYTFVVFADMSNRAAVKELMALKAFITPSLPARIVLRLVPDISSPFSMWFNSMFVAMVRFGKVWDLANLMFHDIETATGLITPWRLDEVLGAMEVDSTLVRKIADGIDVGAYLEGESRVATYMGLTSPLAVFFNGAPVPLPIDPDKLMDMYTLEEAVTKEYADVGLDGEQINKVVTDKRNMLLSLYQDKFGELVPELVTTYSTHPAQGAIRRFEVPIGPDEPTLGPDDAALTLVLYLNLECPHSKEMYKHVLAMRKAFPTSLRVVVRSNIVSVFPLSVVSARALEAAKAQGKFFPFLDAAINQEQSITEEGLVAVAEQVGLDVAAFQKAMASEETTASIVAQAKAAYRIDARGTPVAYVNGRKVLGVQSSTKLFGILDEELKLATSLVQKGIPKESLQETILGLTTVRNIVSEQGHDLPDALAPLLGEPTAPHTITLFVDVLDHFSKNLILMVDKLLAVLPNVVNLRLLPIPKSANPHAEAAAMAVWCAYKQDALATYLGPLLSMGEIEGDHVFTTMAASIGLDVPAFSTCMKESEGGKKLLDQSLAALAALDLKGIPYAFLDGHKLQPPVSYNLAFFTKVMLDYAVRPDYDWLELKPPTERPPEEESPK